MDMMTAQEVPVAVAPLDFGTDGSTLLATAHACASAFTRIVDIPCPDVVPFEGQGRRILGGEVSQAFGEGRFFAAFVPGGIGGTLVLNERMASRLPDEAVPALVAHEMGHAADWLLMARLRVLCLLPGGGRRLQSPTSPLGPEVFADRVAAHLVGTPALRLLYLASFHVQGRLDPSHARMLARLSSMPERPSLPPSLRFRLALRAAARLRED